MGYAPFFYGTRLSCLFKLDFPQQLEHLAFAIGIFSKTLKKRLKKMVLHFFQG